MHPLLMNTGQKKSLENVQTLDTSSNYVSKLSQYTITHLFCVVLRCIGPIDYTMDTRISERPNLELFDFVEPNSNSNFYHRTRTELEPNFSVIKWQIFSRTDDFQQFQGKKQKPKYELGTFLKRQFSQTKNRTIWFIFRQIFLVCCLLVENGLFRYGFGSILVR